jgi:nicotinamide-nucleotide amidase
MIEIITIGNELLSGSTIDTNAAFLASKVNSIGLHITRIITVGDNVKKIIAALKSIRGPTRFVIITGGLGPTEDDCTAEAAAQAFGKKIVLNQKALATMRRRFGELGRKLPKASRKQALLPQGCQIIPNPIGTACGFVIIQGQKRFIFLPGVPDEVKAITQKFMLAYLEKQSGSKEVIITNTLRVFGIGESAIQESLLGLLPASKTVSLAYLPQYPEIHLKLTGKGVGAKAVQAEIDLFQRKIYEKLKDFIYSRNDEPLEMIVGRLLRESKNTLAVAESCTGGLITHRLTNIPGSSDYFERAVVAYSNQSKTELLKVPSKILRRFGAVSEKTAESMAQGVRQLAGATLGLAVTGIAGPSGATPKKPVGTVFIGLASPDTVTAKGFRFYGDREKIKQISSSMALTLLKTFILKTR